MADEMLGKQYVVFTHWETTHDATEILLVTADPQHAVTHAQHYHGVVYAYDVTAQEEYQNEMLVYDGTTRAGTGSDCLWRGQRARRDVF
jgi:hypothetical protein